MPKVQFYTEVKVRLYLEYNSDINKSKHIGCEYIFNASKNTDINKYLDEDGLPNAEGTDVVVKTLVSGLAAAIHAGHQRGFKDSAVCMREAISLLEQQFITPAEISKGKMEDYEGED